MIKCLTGCFSIFSKKIKASNSSLESVYDKICSNIYSQLLMMEGIRKIKRIDADLMMEQSVVCGLLGYYEFLSPTRMENLIKWQRASGCYGDIKEEENSNGNHSKQTMRKILMEKELSGKLFLSLANKHLQSWPKGFGTQPLFHVLCMKFAANRQYSHREQALHLPRVNARASGEAPRIRHSFRGVALA